jgi:hypothetical protein
MKVGDRVIVSKGPDKWRRGRIAWINEDVVGVATDERRDGSWVLPLSWLVPEEVDE